MIAQITLALGKNQLARIQLRAVRREKANVHSSARKDGQQHRANHARFVNGRVVQDERVTRTQMLRAKQDRQ